MSLEDFFNNVQNSPVELFVSLWDVMIEMGTYRRTTADRSRAQVEEFYKLLHRDSAIDASAAAKSRLLAVKGSTRQEFNGAVIDAMAAIDECFLRIHPRQDVRVRSLSLALPQWLDQCRDTRLVDGAYHNDNLRRLVCRGPLARAPRPMFSSGGECVEEYFAALSIVPTTFLNHGRTVKVQHLVLPSGGIRGMASRNPGAERIGFVPVAREASELKLSCFVAGAQNFLSVALDGSVDAVREISSACIKAEKLDILIAPELVVSQEDGEKLAIFLNQSVDDLPRMVVAGSGGTIDKDTNDLPYNETRVLNSLGIELWRQRKVWTSGFTAQRAHDYGLGAGASGFILEGNAESDSVTITDIDDFGRCLVLICQDIESRPLSQDIIQYYQPDWVFVPILDQGVREGRWAHQRVFELSALSNSRFIVASSLALVPVPPGPDMVPCGLAVGPKSATEMGLDSERQFRSAMVSGAPSDGFSVIEWRDGNWETTVLKSQTGP